MLRLMIFLLLNVLKGKVVKILDLVLNVYYCIAALSICFYFLSIRRWLMFDLFIYCFLGLCIMWNVGLVIYMMFESAQDVRELENICNSHKFS